MIQSQESAQGRVLTLPRVFKVGGGGGPLVVNENVTFLLSEVKYVSPMHHSWYWTGWEKYTEKQPTGSLPGNIEHYKKQYPTAVGGETCTVVAFKDGTDILVHANYEDVDAAVYAR